MPLKATARKTADLVKDLCTQLGHEEGASSCIKKLVADNWLVTVSDLQEVPLETFEKYGLPLKLCFKLVEHLAEQKAADYWNGVNATINYTLRPGIARLTTSTVSFLQKKTNPEVWAAQRMQAWFRRRQKIRQLEADKAESGETEDADEVQRIIDEEMETGEFRRLGRVQTDALRRKRAEATIGRYVRKWKARRAQRSEANANAQPRRSSIGWSIANDITKLRRLSQDVEPPKDCPVSQLMLEIGIEQLELPKDEVVGYVHQVVTQHWLEDFDDLDLASSSHWLSWGVPDELVEKVHEKTRSSVTQTVNNVFGWAGSLFGSADSEEVASSPSSGRRKRSGLAWFCPECSTCNESKSLRCVACDKQRVSPEDAREKELTRERRVKQAEQRKKRNSASFEAPSRAASLEEAVW